MVRTKSKLPSKADHSAYVFTEMLSIFSLFCFESLGWRCRRAAVCMRYLQQDLCREKLRDRPQVSSRPPLQCAARKAFRNGNICRRRWSHVSEKPLSCDRCTMTFTSKAQFAVHIRTHSAGQNYECSVCGRTFIRDSYLIR